ncbi:MAG: zinc metalloprotease HtpX [Solirubrobacteraceae bacterium]
MPSPRSLHRDRRLQARMLFTILLLGLFYVLLITVLIAAGAGVVLVVAIAGVLFLVQYFSSERIALAALGARGVDAGDAPQVHGAIERLCIEADLPMPRVALVVGPMPNAFAVGRSSARATVCVTTGLLSTLHDGELEAVLAHELSHIQHHDVMLITVAGFFASLAAFIVQMELFAFRAIAGARERGLSSTPMVAIVTGLAYLTSFVLIQALSRDREFAADRGSAIITGRPGALSSALIKISERMDQIPQRDLRAASGEMAAFAIFPPSAKDTAAGLFATHPPLEARVAALDRLEAQLQATA